MKDARALASYPAVTPSDVERSPADYPTVARSDVERSPADRGAEALFRSHSRFVADFAYRLGVQRQELDDVVQEVFLAAHRQGGYMSGAASPTSWLGQMTLLAVKGRRRTARRRPEGGEELDSETMAATGAGPFEALASAQALGRVQRALEALDLDARTVFILFEIEEEPCDAIAASLGVPVGTVYSRLHGARRRFQEAYDRIGRIEAAAAARRAPGRSQ